MKVLVDSHRKLSPDEIECGMAQYTVLVGIEVIDSDNDLIALAKRHDLDPADVKSIQDTKK